MLEGMLDDIAVQGQAAELLEPVYAGRADWPALIKIGEIRLVQQVAVKTDLAGVKTDLAGVKTDLAGVKTDLAGVRLTWRGSRPTCGASGPT